MFALYYLLKIVEEGGIEKLFQIFSDGFYFLS